MYSCQVVGRGIDLVACSDGSVLERLGEGSGNGRGLECLMLGLRWNGVAWTGRSWMCFVVYGM